MSEHEQQHVHEARIHYLVDDEPESTHERILTPNQIMQQAGVDPAANYLEQLVPGKEPISYKSNPDESIEMHDGMRFITKPTGPMPVSR